MQESTVKECTAIVLDNGEHLPTLQEYLEKARNLKNPPHLGIKGSQNSRTRNACRKKRF